MRHLKLFFACMLMAVLSIGQVWGASPATITFSSLELSNGEEYTDPFDVDGSVSVTFGSGGKYYNTGSAMRIYGGGTMTVSGVTGITITGISLSFGTGDGTKAITTNVGTYSDGTWTGSANSVVFSAESGSGHRRVASVTITYSGGGSTPSLSLNPSSLNLEAEGNTLQTIALTANNFSSGVNNVECAFYSAAGCAAGDAISQPAWITDLTDNNSNQVTFNVADNESVARQTWMKITASKGTESASAVLAISQKVYVVDYATLPFEFNGGKNDIESTSGVTQSGLGSDYTGSGVTTKLKFDGTGDWLIIKINAAPGTLSYDIKGNSFSGGTFTVQQSADGEYCDRRRYIHNVR